MIIYRAINLENGKVYIGQTIRSLDERKREHELESSRTQQFLFHKALNKYGAESFVWEIIDTADNMDELNAKEIKYIELYDSFKNGYNSTTGGMNYTLSEDAKAKISKASKQRLSIPENNPMYGVQLCGEKNGMYGKTHSKATKKKISESAKERYKIEPHPRSGISNYEVWLEKYGKEIADEKQLGFISKMSGENHPFYGKSRSEETKRKIGEGNRGKIISQEQRKKMSEARIGKFCGEDNPMYGAVRSDLTKHNTTEVICPHCGKVGRGIAVMKRWHFDNCKHKP